MNTSNLLGDRPENLQKVLKVYNKTIEDHDGDVVIIKKWIESQPHLPEMPRDELISNTLIRCKFSIEKCKTTIDMYYTIRSLMPDVFDRSENRLDKIENYMKEQEIFVPLPKLTKDGYRIIWGKIYSDPKELDAYDMVNGRAAIFEIRYLEDAVAGDIHVEDLSEFKLGHLTKFTPMVVKKCVTMYETVYNNRIKAIHFFNMPSAFEGLFNLIKKLMKPKLAARIHGHTNAEFLKTAFTPDQIPIEYGGTGPSLTVLRELWMKKFKECRPIFAELDKLRTEESKRPTPLINDEVLGYYGNFKKLNID